MSSFLDSTVKTAEEQKLFWKTIFLKKCFHGQSVVNVKIWRHIHGSSLQVNSEQTLTSQLKCRMCTMTKVLAQNSGDSLRLLAKNKSLNCYFCWKHVTKWFSCVFIVRMLQNAGRTPSPSTQPSPSPPRPVPPRPPHVALKTKVAVK